MFAGKDSALKIASEEYNRVLKQIYEASKNPNDWATIYIMQMEANKKVFKKMDPSFDCRPLDAKIAEIQKIYTAKAGDKTRLVDKHFSEFKVSLLLLAQIDGLYNFSFF